MWLPGTMMYYNRDDTSIGKNILCMVLAYKGKTPMVQILRGKLAGNIIYVPANHLSREMVK